ncbi:MAG: alpha/beta fold hydrolase [Candidatus Omnitrophota bacterium]|nr:alpha/beta fold hydrolase [Candidatus Omnitrophota bacterium]MDZ4242713.1 alpha/beta fold hydrolase [Candidatus Omnitrophota bacterium]
MPYLKTKRGMNWHYEVEGQGDPILFIHGWGVDSRIWRQQVKHFSARFCAVAVDLPGHGKTEWRKISLAEIAGDIREVLWDLGLEKVGVVGSSLGGLVALKLFAIAPQAVRFLVFVGSQPRFSRSEDYPYGLEVSRIRKLAAQLNSDYPSMVNIFFRSLFTHYERGSRRYKWIQTFRQNIDFPHKEALLQMLDVLENEDLREHMPRGGLPVQFINGTDDYICPKELFTYFSRTIPGATLDLFPRCGHFPFLTKPYEFNETIERFLSSFLPRQEK